MKQRICQPAQAMDRNVLEDYLESQPLIGTKQKVSTFAQKIRTEKRKRKACKRTQIAPFVEPEKSEDDQNCFQKRQIHWEISIATKKRKRSAVTDLINVELYTDADMAASRSEWEGDVVALHTNISNNTLAHKRFK